MVCTHQLLPRKGRIHVVDAKDILRVHKHALLCEFRNCVRKCLHVDLDRRVLRPVITGSEILEPRRRGYVHADIIFACGRLSMGILLESPTSDASRVFANIDEPSAASAGFLKVTYIPDISKEDTLCEHASWDIFSGRPYYGRGLTDRA